MVNNLCPWPRVLHPLSGTLRPAGATRKGDDKISARERTACALGSGRVGLAQLPAVSLTRHLLATLSEPPSTTTVTLSPRSRRSKTRAHLVNSQQ